MTRSFDVFFDLRPNKRLSKQSWRRWFETQSRSLWRHCNGISPNYSWVESTKSLHRHVYIYLDEFHFYPRPVLAFGYCRCLRLCVCVSVCVCVNHGLVRTITHHPFKLESLNLEQRYKRPRLRSLLFFGDDRLWPSRSNWTWKSNFTSFWACPPHNSSAVQARITKFRPKMNLSTVKIPINFGLDWFWSSPSFSILKPIFLPNLFALFLYYI